MRRIIENGGKSIRKATKGPDLLKYRYVKAADAIINPNLGAVLLYNEQNLNRLTPPLISELLYSLHVPLFFHARAFV